MDVKAAIESLKAEIKRKGERIRWLQKHRAVLESLPSAAACGDIVDFDFLNHKEVIGVVRALGGKWQKSSNPHAEAPTREKGQSIDYQSTVDGVRVRCWGAEPPPSCRIVEVEEVIPAHDIPAQHVPEKRVKVKKMICTGKDEPLLVSMSRVLKPNGEANGS